MFYALHNGNYLKKESLFASIGSTSSESALNFKKIEGSGIYALSKLAQKSLIVQLMKVQNNYRFLNLTLGSIGDGTGDDGYVGHKNIIQTILNAYEMGKNVRYTEVSLVSQLDVE